MRQPSAGWKTHHILRHFRPNRWCHNQAVPKRRVLITGASRGIGAAIARAFAQEGDRVAIHYSTAKSDAEAVLEALAGEGHLVVGADLRRRDEIQALMEAIQQEWGGLDVLVNNAGIVHRVDTACEDVAEWSMAWDDTFEVNVLGPAVLTWHALRLMGPGGRIVNMASRAAFRGMPDSIPYAASKAAVAAMSQSLAQSLAERGIAVTAVAPGYVETDMGRLVLDGEQGEAIRRQSPFHRVATSEEIAHAILYLASPAAEWASGAILDLNGASHLRM
ncbi:MAG TPA: 3-oxoacyl-ACP reductase [Actinobacteria bacterium]|jgi:3-oxoacyl-[acyl-carrier protein] reductase|nr:3-oxoacyl-ACP reductase [Actinomycetota bacterium]